jgi:hypothetical protein
MGVVNYNRIYFNEQPRRAAPRYYNDLITYISTIWSALRDSFTLFK